MSKPLWESHFEAAGGVVTDEIRRRVNQMATAGMPPSPGDALASVLMGRGLTACQAEKASQQLRETFARATKAVRKFGDACGKIQSNHQGKRKQGMRNSYGTKWGGQ